MSITTCDYRNCKFCYEVVNQRSDREKQFCGAKCNNDYYVFKTKSMSEITDPELRAAFQKQMDLGVPIIILANIWKNIKKDSLKSKRKDAEHSSQVVLFYKNLVLNFEQFSNNNDWIGMKRNLLV